MLGHAKWPGLGGRKEVVSTCHGKEGVGHTMVYNEKPRSSGCSSSEQKSLGFTTAYLEVVLEEANFFEMTSKF